MIEQLKEIGLAISSKVHPILEYISQKIGNFIDVSSENVHLMLVGAISLYLSSIIFGRDKLGIAFWVAGIGIFLLLKHLGF